MDTAASSEVFLATGGANAAGRVHALQRLGLGGRMLKAAFSSRGAWHMARTGSVHKALSNAVLRRYGFLMPSDLAAIR